MGHFIIHLADDNRFYFNLMAGNNEVVLTSQMYASKQGAHVGIESVKVNAPIADRYEKRTSARGKPYFVLKAANHEVIGASEEYESESNRDRGMDAVKDAAAIAEIRDLCEMK